VVRLLASLDGLVALLVVVVVPNRLLVVLQVVLLLLLDILLLWGSLLLQGNLLRGSLLLLEVLCLFYRLAEVRWAVIQVVVLVPHLADWVDRVQQLFVRTPLRLRY